MHQRSPSSSLRSPVFWAEPVPVEVLLKSELSSWMIPPVPLSVTSRAQSAKTTFSAYSNPSVKLEDWDKLLVMVGWLEQWDFLHSCRSLLRLWAEYAFDEYGWISSRKYFHHKIARSMNSRYKCFFDNVQILRREDYCGLGWYGFRIITTSHQFFEGLDHDYGFGESRTVEKVQAAISAIHYLSNLCPAFRYEFWTSNFADGNLSEFLPCWFPSLPIHFSHLQPWSLGLFRLFDFSNTSESSNN